MTTDNSTYKERLRGHKDCMTEYFNIKAVKYIELDLYPKIKHAFNSESIKSSIYSFLQDNPDTTALITTNVALEYVFSYLDEAGRSDLNDLYLVIIDGPEYMSMVKNRNVMIIDQNPRQIGRIAAEQLYKQMYDKANPQEIITSGKIIEL